MNAPLEGEAVALDELVVAPLGADPDPRLQGGVRQPAEPAEGRRGEEGAARGEAARPQLRGALVEHGVDPGREGRALHRDPPVALDEQQQDVLAAQAGQQPVAGSGAEAVAGDLAGEDLLGAQAALDRLHLADGEGGGARGGDRRADDAQGHPDDAEHGGGRQRPVAVAGRDAREAQQRQDREGEEPDEEHDDGGDGEVRARPADRVAQRLDADPHVARVGDGVERPVEGRDEPHVEDLHDARAPPAALRRPRPARGAGWRAAARPAATTTRSSRGSRTNAPTCEAARLVRRDEGGPDEQQGEDRERHGDARAQRPALGAAGVARRRLVGRGVPAAPQPPRALAERRRQRGERGDQERLRERPGQHLGGRDRQHDPLRRRDDPAPAARRQRRAHPRQQPLAGEEQVARRPDREHPRAERGGDVDAEREDQERVDLAVEARAQPGRRPGAPRHPSVDRVQRERDGGERHEQRDRRVVRERVRGQRGDADGERGPRERHPRRRPQPVAATAREAARQRRRHGRGAGDADDPAGRAEPGGRRQDGEQQHLGDQPDRRTRLTGSHRASEVVSTSRTHVNPDARAPSHLPGAALRQDPGPMAPQASTAMRQDDRAPFDRALHRARVSAYAPGEFVGQESFMTAGEIRALAVQAGIGPGVTVLDLCCGIAGPGRFLTRELGCAYLGVDASASAVAIARERAGDLPCRFAVAQIPPLPPALSTSCSCSRRCSPSRTRTRWSREIAAALRPGGRFAFTLEEGPPLTAAERAAMPDADTVWLTPLDEMAASLERAGLVVTWQEDHSRAHRAMAQALADAFAADAEDIAAQIGRRALDELLAAHRLWIEWLDEGRVRKLALVAQRA